MKELAPARPRKIFMSKWKPKKSKNWEDERSPDGVSLQRYQHSFPDNWSGEDGVYACYNLDPATSSFTQSSISFLEKIASGLPGYDDLEAVWICGNAGRKRYHFTGTTPNVKVEREKIDNLQLFIDTTVMNQIQDNTTQATKANDDLGIFQNSSRDDAGASTTIGSIGEPGAAEVLSILVC